MSGTTNNNAERERSGSAHPDHQEELPASDGLTEFTRAGPVNMAIYVCPEKCLTMVGLIPCIFGPI